MSKGKWNISKEIEDKIKEYFSKKQKDGNAKPSSKKSK